MNSSSRKIEVGQNVKLLVMCLLWSIVLVGTLCLLFEPRWETNDDVGMSMVAQGFGIAAYPSPYTIFSNILWGYFVHIFPTINGVPGYSLATFMVLVLVGTTIQLFLIQIGVRKDFAFLLVLVIIARPTVFPQFTINAGLLTVSAVIGWNVYHRQLNVGSLILSCIMAFLGFLIRSQEFLFVLLVALPYIPWHRIKDDRRFQLALTILVGLIAAAKAIDYFAYSTVEWDRFRSLNLIRAAYTDFGAVAQLQKRTDILQRFGYSENDLTLIGNFFFADPSIANPEKLQGMLSSLDTLPFLTVNFNMAFNVFSSLVGKELLPLTSLAVALNILLPSKNNLYVWGIFIFLLFFQGLLGRPSPIRVCIPVVTFIILVSVFSSNFSSAKILIVLLLSFSSVFMNIKELQDESRNTKQLTGMAQSIVKQLPFDNSYVNWGAAFPFEYIYPVLDGDVGLKKVNLYSLGVFTLAPFSISYKEEDNGEGFIKRFRSTDGIKIILKPNYLPLLEIYCKEHFGSKLNILYSEINGFYKLVTVTCRN